MIGKVASHDKILEHHGGGSSGVVYNPQDLKLDRLVALKPHPPKVATDRKLRERFIQEPRTFRRAPYGTCERFRAGSSSISEDGSGRLDIKRRCDCYTAHAAERLNAKATLGMNGSEQHDQRSAW